MSTVTYISSDGEQQTVDVPVGTTVMQAGVNAGVDGIVAECGGSLSCATCHVYVDSSPEDAPEVSSEEEEMLDWTASTREDSSRLSCQLRIQNEDDVYFVRVPEKQV